jgi:hypothetical protein
MNADGHGLGGEGEEARARGDTRPPCRPGGKAEPASSPTPGKSNRLNVCGGCGLAPSIMRPTKMLAAWTSSARLICWH